jgi:hypothetical protein
MELWQYNAWGDAFRDKQIDKLAIQIQAEYLGAYWGGLSNKRKKSLDAVLSAIHKKKPKHVKREPIDVEAIEKDFQRLEELKANGWYSC